MIRNAVGTVISRTIVTATTNRTIGRFAARMSRIGLPSTTIPATSPTVSRMSSGMTVKTIFPGNVSRSQLRPMHGHLSTPPMIGSRDAITAIVSAIK